MKIGLWSDLHGEFYRNSSFLRDIPLNQEWELLVIAGDLGYIHNYQVSRLLIEIERLTQSKIPILFVAGNHEYYRNERTISEDLAFLSSTVKQHTQIHVLNNDIFEFKGQRFLGTTLWFKDSILVSLNSRMLNDYGQIERFSEQVKAENKKSLNFLEQNLQKNDIVITHHLPSSRSEVFPFQNTPTSIFFVCDVENLIADRKPSHWLHGHTHASVDYNFFDCRIKSNPRGYPHDLNPQFIPDLIIETKEN